MADGHGVGNNGVPAAPPAQPPGQVPAQAPDQPVTIDQIRGLLASFAQKLDYLQGQVATLQKKKPEHLVDPASVKWKKEGSRLQYTAWSDAWDHIDKARDAVTAGNQNGAKEALKQGSLKENFCTDLSFWDVIKYTSSSAMCCDTVLKKDCITKTERVCADATEIKCNTVGWAECATKVWSAQDKKCDVSYKDFPYNDCKDFPYSVKHTKQVPKCKTVTKDNCFPDWRTGQEKCEPISWEECELPHCQDSL